MTNRRWIAGLAVLLLLAVGALLLVRPWETTAPEETVASRDTQDGAPAAEAESSARPATVFAEGRLVPLRQTNLAFETGGRLAEALVTEGDEVAAGAPLLRLETSEADIAVRQAEAALAQSEANLAAARARLLSARAGQRTARLAIAAAGAELDVVSAGPREEAIATAEGAVAEANATVAQAAGERDAALETNSAEIAAAEARLVAAEANRFAVRIANEPLIQDEEAAEEERIQAQLRLNAAEAEVAAAQAELARAQAGATEAVERAAVSAVTTAAARRDVAEAQLVLLASGARQEEMAVVQEKVRQAESAAAQAEISVSLAETAVRQAEAGVAIARSRLSAAQTALEKLTLTAPFAGTVAAVHVKEAQTATAGIPAVTLADFGSWQVETTDLTELDVAQVSEGQLVQVTVDAFPGETIAGTIVAIAAAPQATGAGLPGLGDDVTYEVTVALEETGSLALRWGMTAFVTVEGATAQRSTQPVIGAIDVKGELVPGRFAELSFQTGGTVGQIAVSEGQEVAAGEPMIQLEGQQQALALEQARGQLAAAQAALEVAENHRAAAQAAIETANREVDVAVAQLALVQAGVRPEELAAAEAQLAAARSGVAQAAASRDAQLERVGTEEQIQSARAALASAQAEVSALQDQYDTLLDACIATPQGEVCPLYGPVEETMRAQLQAARAGAAAAQAALDRLLAGATEAQQRAANAAVSAAIARRDQAEAQLALLQAGAGPELIRQAQIALEIAQAQVAVAEAALDESEAAVAQAEAAVAAAEAGVEAAETAVERTILRAPYAGRVVRLAVNPGELVPPGFTVVTLADADLWRVETRELTELDVARLQIGDVVSVSFDALPQVALPGTVTQIALTPGIDRGDVVYQATIDLEETEGLSLRWGMTARLTLGEP
jgi:HlyD family secretion protein